MKKIVLACAILLHVVAVAQNQPLSLPAKKGACFTLKPEPNKGKNSNHIINAKRIKQLNVGWNYSWSPVYAKTQPSKCEFVPMFWSALGDTVALHNLREYIKNGKVKMVLGFNEPDAKDQGNVSVEKALEQWPLLESLGVPLASPAPVSAEKAWLEEFMKGAKERGYRVDCISVHDYGGGNAKSFMAKLERIYKKFGLPIIITEFAVADWKATTLAENRVTKEHVLKYMKEVLPMLEKADYVIGYSWFSFNEQSVKGGPSALFDKEDKLTELGKFYSKFKPE